MKNFQKKVCRKRNFPNSFYILHLMNDTIQDMVPASTDRRTLRSYEVFFNDNFYVIIKVLAKLKLFVQLG